MATPDTRRNGALDQARVAFDRLVTGPRPVAVDGGLFPGFPSRPVPLDEARDVLLRRDTPQSTRDALWAHVIHRSRTDKVGTWTVACVGLALPALIRVSATLSARFAADPADIHAAVLAGFIGELTSVDVTAPRIMLRLRWAAYRAGHRVVIDALTAPIPIDTRCLTETTGASESRDGHPDLVLARAVADGVLTREDAALIGVTRLEGIPLAEAALRRRASYEATKKARRRAERRLASHLDAADASSRRRGPRPRRTGRHASPRPQW